MEGKKRASESDAEAFPSKRRTPCKNPTLVIVGGDAKPQQAIFLRLSRSARSIQMPIAIPLNALRGCAGVSVCVCIWDMHVRCMHMHFHVHIT